MERQIQLSDYKLIVFDIDGTIQNSNHELHPFTKDVLLKLHDAGILFTLATGKNLPAVKPLAESLNIKIPLILSNGCMIQRVDGMVLEKFSLPSEITKQVMQICDSGEWDLAVYLEDGIYIKHKTYNLDLLRDYGAPGLIEVKDWRNLNDRIGQIHKGLVVNRSSVESVYQLEKEYRKAFGDRVEYCHTLPSMLEVMPKGVSKLSAVRRLSEMLDVTMEEVMTFGDGNNDIEMLKGSGLGVTMENGSEQAKANANITIASSDENGPAKFLHTLLTQHRQK